MTGTGRAELVVVCGGVTPVAADGVERVIARLRADEPRMGWTPSEPDALRRRPRPPREQSTRQRSTREQSTQQRSIREQPLNQAPDHAPKHGSDRAPNHGSGTGTGDGPGAGVWSVGAGPGRVVVVHHDLAEVGHGVVRRHVRTESIRGTDIDEITVLEFAHGCVSCAVREEILPLLRALGRDPSVGRIVLHLDPVLEPGPVCSSILNTLVGGVPVTDAITLRGVINVLDVGSWLDDSTGSRTLEEWGLASLPGEQRTIAQLVVAHAELADLIVYAGHAEGWLQARTGAILARLTPLAPRLSVSEVETKLLSTRWPDGARRGRPESAHAPLLRGQPPLDASAGVQLTVFTARRPFHPDRLHRAIDVLLGGVVRTRGRVWVATRPDAVLWIESAGADLHVGYAGDWLAAGDAQAWQDADPERHAQAALRWHVRWGDRAQDLAILVHEADPGEIEAELRSALLTDTELMAGERAWADYPDPFGWWHSDPCDEITPTVIGSDRLGPTNEQNRS